MVLSIVLFIFLIGFVIAWARTDELTHQISAAVFLILIYINGNQIYSIQAAQKLVLDGVALIIEQNKHTIDLKLESTARQPKFHSA